MFCYSGVMKIRWRLRRLAYTSRRHLVSHLRPLLWECWPVRQLRQFYAVLLYNYFNSWEMALETAVNPLMLFLAEFSAAIGPIMVVVVVTLVSSVIFIFYLCLLPHRFFESYFWTGYHLVFGHWLLVNIVFHYFKAVFTDPGSPPAHIKTVVAICRRCISPKPPRSHHCGVCRRCILKMDHHCPWINNCVGLRNHRYFYLFMFYLWLGCLYVCIKAYPEFKRHFYGERFLEDVPFPGPLFLINLPWMPKEDAIHRIGEDRPCTPPVAPPDHPLPARWLHLLISYEYMLTSTVFLALGLLLIYHTVIISRGETSIEAHLNKKARSRLAKRGLVFRNFYHFGVLGNWRRFLGLHAPGRSVFWHLLLPSSHTPDSDGVTFESTLMTVDEMVDLLA